MYRPMSWVVQVLSDGFEREPRFAVSRVPPVFSFTYFDGSMRSIKSRHERVTCDIYNRLRYEVDRKSRNRNIRFSTLYSVHLSAYL